jgi:hypothetical protein
MHRSSHLGIVVGAIAMLLFCPTSRSQDEDCKNLAKQVLQDEKALDENGLLDTNVLRPVNAISCFIESNSKVAVQSLVPTRPALWNALNNLAGDEQQGSSVKSGGSTNAVSKPSGPSSLIEEFGGANVTTGASSFTVQWSPGTMLTNLTTAGVINPCLDKGTPPGCISVSALKKLTPLTLKITASTSNGTSSLSGQSSGASSGAASQQVAVNSKGGSGPGFTGLTAQYSFFGKKAAGVPSATSQAVSTELGSANDALQALMKCNPITPNPQPDNPTTIYDAWKRGARNEFVASGLIVPPDNKRSKEQDDALVSALQQRIESEYGILWNSLSTSCPGVVDKIKALYSAVLTAMAEDVLGTTQQATLTPEMALEYDLNTPQDQPSYSTAKFTLNWQFGKCTPGASGESSNASCTKAKASKSDKAVQTKFEAAVSKQTASATNATGSGSGNIANQTTAAAKPVAQAIAQPWSLTLSGDADVYHSEPPASVPSASHWRDIQAGAEISRLITPSANSNGFWTFVGPITASAAYSYQDQTSPAILTGPALSDFTGLPSSTTSAYAKRGVIHLGQVRLGFGQGANTSFPLVFTYSNRTELVVHPTWGVQFGVSYNLNSLFSSSSAR